MSQAAAARSASRRLWSIRLEWFLALCVLGTLIMNMIKLFKTHGQPQPFFFYIDDVFADWFNTAQFSHLPGAYEVWGAIYPPISFLFLQVFSLDACYGSYGMGIVRDCDWIGRLTIFASFALCCWVAWRGFRYVDRGTALPRAIAFSCGLPIWYGLERGQLLLVAFPLMVLAHGPVKMRSAPLRWLASAVLINFKPYMLAGLLPDMARRRWLGVEVVTLLTVAVYVATWAILRAGDPITVYKNIVTFSQNAQGGGWGEIYYAATYKSLINMLTVNPVAIFEVGIRVAEAGVRWFTFFMRLTQAAILLTLVAAWIKPVIASRQMLAGLSIGLAIISTITGGYSMMIIVYFAFLEPMRGPARTIALVACYLLSLQADYVVAVIETVYQPSYFFGGFAQQTYGIGAGVVIRPALVLLVEFCIASSILLHFCRLWREDELRWKAERALATT